MKIDLTTMSQENTSNILHVSIEGITAHFKGEDLIIPPSLELCANALSAGHLFTLKTIETIQLVLDAGIPWSIKTLEEDYRSAWGAVT